MNPEAVAKALREKAGLIPLDQFGFKELPRVSSEGYLFLGCQDYWHQVKSCCGLVALRVDAGLEAEVGRAAARFHEVVRALQPYAASMAPEARLSAAGLLVVFAEGPCNEAVVEHVLSQKRGSFWTRDYVAVWLLDAANRRVATHSGLPLCAYPGRKFFMNLLSEGKVAG